MKRGIVGVGVVVGIVLTSLLLALILIFLPRGCEDREKEQLISYSVSFLSPGSGEVVTNESLEVIVRLEGRFLGDERVKVLLNKGIVFLSAPKEEIRFTTQVFDITNFLECVVEREGSEVIRKGIYFFLFKPKVTKKIRRVKYKHVKVRGLKKYEEVIQQLELPPVLPEIEEKRESEYISSVSLEVLDELGVGYFRDSIKVEYKVNFLEEFGEKAIEYLKGVYLEITDARDRKLFSEYFREPGLALDLDVSDIPSGVYVLTVRAEDVNGKVFEASKWVKIDKIPPRVFIEGLTNNTIVRGSFEFLSRFEDEAGILDFSAYIGRDKLSFRKGKDGAVFFFDSTKFKNGYYQILLSVIDRVSNVFTTNIQVIIDNWVEEVVDSSLGSGFHLASFIDEGNNLYLAYHNLVTRNLVFAQKLATSEKWLIEVVDKEVDTGKYPSIFVDRFGRVHISYTYVNEKWDDEDLRYAVKEGKEWKILSLDQQDKAGRYTSIVVDERGVPHISYYNYTVGSLRYITYSIRMGRWEVSVPDSYENVGSDTSIGIYNNVVHIVYLDNANGDLKYCRKGIEETEVGWKFEVIDSEGKVGYYANMKISKTGDIHVAYYDSSLKALKHAVRTKDGWKITVIDKKDDPGRFVSLFLDQDGNPHISYFVQSRKEIRYAFFDGKKWEVQTVVSEKAGGCSSIVVLGGKPVIFFYDSVANKLKMMKK